MVLKIHVFIIGHFYRERQWRNINAKLRLISMYIPRKRERGSEFEPRPSQTKDFKLVWLKLSCLMFDL